MKMIPQDGLKIVLKQAKLLHNNKCAYSKRRENP